jgi:hypothetical protein
MIIRRLAAGIAALLLATEIAQAVDQAEGWFMDCRRDRIIKDYPKSSDPPVHATQQEDGSYVVVIERSEFETLAKALAVARREFKKCDAFWECVERRGTKWPDGHAWVYPPKGSKLGPGRPDGTQSVVPPKNRPKHCYNP